MDVSIRACLVAVGICAFAQATPAAANPGYKILRGQVTVSYSDLDLRNERDADIMLHRLDKAAVAACGGRPYLTGYERQGVFLEQAFDRCRIEAMSRAVVNLDAAVVTRLYSVRYARAAGAQHELNCASTPESRLYIVYH